MQPLLLLLLLLLVVLCSQGLSRNLIYFDHDHDIETKNETFVVRELKTTKKGYGAICSKQQIDKIDQANILDKKSNCPSRNWLDIVLKESKSRKEINLIVVGCNKGDDYISLMEAFSGNKIYNVTNYVSYLKSKENLYGFACGTAKSRLLPDYPVRPIRGYCIEPLKENYELILSATSNLALGTSSSSSHIMHMAINNFPGTADFPVGGQVGQTRVGLGDKSESTIEVRVDNLDNFIEENKIDSTIDFVSIDVEGFDANVLLGFIRTLYNKNVRFFEFEYHGVRRWASADLELISDAGSGRIRLFFSGEP